MQVLKASEFSFSLTQHFSMDIDENKHVHEVYEHIACHFSKTRYKPWPRVDEFIKSQPKGSVGCDVGGGNGKYLDYPHVYIMGCDRSEKLAEIASLKSLSISADMFRCDGLALPFCSRMDFAICIAVIHHFSTKERRVRAIKAVLNTLSSEGTVLFYVWALEQKHSRRGWNEDMPQDVMVPWIDMTGSKKVYDRFYHLYRKGELEKDVEEASGFVIESGYERDNWWCVATISQAEN